MEGYRFEERLGKGSYAEVKKAINLLTNEVVAVKIFDKKKLNRNKKTQVERELQALKTLKGHPNIVEFLDYKEDENHLYIVMQYCSGGDLLSRLRGTKGFPEDICRIYFKQIISALEFTHKNGFIHRDVKLENILFDDKDNIRLADWGFSGPWMEGVKQKSLYYSVHYAPPEAVKRKEYIGPELDIWSAGVLLYALHCGNFPFYGEKLQQNIKKTKYQIPSNFSPALKSLLSVMMKKKGKYRIHADKILQHPWCTNGIPEKSLSEESLSNGNNDALNKEKENNSTYLPADLCHSESLLSKIFHKLSPKSIDGGRPKSYSDDLSSLKPRTGSVEDKL